jgi:hypothetical protein
MVVNSVSLEFKQQQKQLFFFFRTSGFSWSDLNWALRKTGPKTESRNKKKNHFQNAFFTYMPHTWFEIKNEFRIKCSVRMLNRSFCAWPLQHGILAPRASVPMNKTESMSFMT